MTRALITAFEPYDRWSENSSWAALIELTSWYDGDVEIVTRRYPVDLAKMSTKLRGDIAAGYDVAIHLGQSPSATLIRLEAVGLNVRTDGSPLVDAAAQAYRSTLPLDSFCKTLNEKGIPAEVSMHAGTYLCNAALYLSQHYASAMGSPTKSMFIHLPLMPAQAARHVAERLPSMSTAMCAAAIAVTIDAIDSVAANPSGLA